MLAPVKHKFKKCHDRFFINYRTLMLRSAELPDKIPAASGLNTK